MNQKVICDRAHLCDERGNDCNHSEPHFPEIFQTSTHSDVPDRTCIEQDYCMEHTVRCIPIGIDFEIEELFLL